MTGEIVDTNFWHERWENNDIGFHQSEPNPLLVEHFIKLSPSKDSRILVPLCGKTIDISWLLSQRCQVVGIELSKTAVEQLFADLGMEPRVSQADKLVRYSDDRIDIFVGDFFALTAELLGPVDVVYDRAALIALPDETRQRYTARLMEITGRASQLLICCEYDQSLMEGPPFSVTGEEVHQHYDVAYDLTLLASADIPGGLKGKCPAKEHAWLLSRRRNAKQPAE